MMLSNAIIFLTSAIAIGMANGSMHDKIEKFSDYAELLDKSISEENENQCFEKIVCVLESSDSETTTDGPLESFHRILTNSDNDFNEDEFTELQQIVKNNTHLHRLTDSVRNGLSFGDADRCNDHYPACNISANRTLEAMENLDQFGTTKDRQGTNFMSRRRRRKNRRPKGKRGKINWPKSCANMSNLCTLITVGSVLCTIFSLGGCAPSLLTTAACLAIDICSKH